MIFLLYQLSWMNFLEAFSPQLVDSNMPLDPSTRNWISLSAAKHRPVFCCCFGSCAREITLGIQKRGVSPTETYRKVKFLIQGVISLVPESKQQHHS